MVKKKKQLTMAEWMQENPWRAASIFLGILVLSLIVMDYVGFERIGNVKISDADLESFQEILTESNATSMKICDLEEKQCFVISKQRKELLE